MGFEPMTSILQVWRSAELSYGGVLSAGDYNTRRRISQDLQARFWQTQWMIPAERRKFTQSTMSSQNIVVTSGQ
jgi:hypothetical protein